MPVAIDYKTTQLASWLQVVFYAIMLFVLSTAFGVFGQNPISGYLTSVINYLPLVFVAIGILVIGAAVAATVRGGGINPMSQRWQAMADRYDQEKDNVRQQARSAPSIRQQAQGRQGWVHASDEPECDARLAAILTFADERRRMVIDPRRLVRCEGGCLLRLCNACPGRHGRRMTEPRALMWTPMASSSWRPSAPCTPSSAA